MKKILFLGLFPFILYPCFSQQLNDIELVGQKISLIKNSYDENKLLINSIKMIEILDIMNNIFNESSNYRFTNVMSHGTDKFRVFNNKDLIAELTLVMDFQLNGYNRMEYIYVTALVYQNKNVSDIKISAVNKSSDNICFSFDYQDLDNKIMYVYEYYTNQYEMFVIHEFALLDAPSYPLIKKTIIYKRS
jgi:hypothetical protein